MNFLIGMVPLRFIKKMSNILPLKFVNTFIEKIPYDLRMSIEFYARHPKLVRQSAETISFLSPKIWALIQQNIKIVAPRYVLKRVLENGNPIIYVMQNIFATRWYHSAQQ